MSESAMKPSRTWWLAALVFSLGCGHDAQRANPFDPTLTPPVSISVSLDDTAGAATVTWSAYQAAAPFAEYIVLRAVDRSMHVDTLARISHVNVSTFVDTTLLQGTGYTYRVTTMNVAGFAVTSAPQNLFPFDLPRVDVAVDFRSVTATAQVSWTPYIGPDFRAYQVRRRSAAEAPRIIHETADASANAYVDSHLRGAVEYFYRVVVLTGRDEEVPSAEVTGSIHGLLAEWPLDVEATSAVQDYVRLYAEPDGRIAVLVSGLGILRTVRTLLYDTQTGQIEAQKHLQHIPPDAVAPLPYHITRAIDAEGNHHLSVTDNGSLRIHRLQPDGSLVERVQQGPVLQLPPTDDDDHAMLGTVLVESPDASLLEIEVSADTSVLSTHFGDLKEEHDYFGTRNLLGWDVSGRAQLLQGILWLRGDARYATTASWPNARAEFLVNSPVRLFTIQLGEEQGGAMVRASIDIPGKLMRLVWSTASRELAASVAIDLLPRPPVRVVVEVSTDLVRSFVSQATAATFPVYEPVTNGGLAPIHQQLALTLGARAYSIGADDNVAALPDLPSWASEIRSWQVPGERGRRIGVSLPEAGKIRRGTVAQGLESRWSSFLTRDIGPWIGAEAGMLGYPLSFDAGPDGRTFILDAGGRRIVVVDRDGNYVTQWHGAGGADFDFGPGHRRREGLDFAGSVCVDAQGFIYVADVFHRRLLKFAP